jgi:hypothetical protein
VAFKFEIKKSINIILFTLKSLGGKYDVYKLFSILYLSDIKHLSRYGSPISGDTFIAMKYGPAPFNAYTIYKQLKGESYLDSISGNIKKFLLINDLDEMIAIESYDEDYLSPSEAECIFETIKEHKNANQEQLKSIVTDISWQLSHYNGRITLQDVINVSGIPNDMIEYIEAVLENESMLFNENVPTNQLKAEDKSFVTRH